MVCIRVPNFMDFGQLFFSVFCALRLKKLVQKHKLDIVHFMGGSGGVQLLAKPPVPAVFTLNNTYFYLHRKFPGAKFAALKSLERISLRNADCRTAISDGIEKEINRQETHAIEVVYIGIDDALFCPKKAARKKIALYSGRLEERKGVLELLDAFEKCAEKKAALWFVGEGALLDRLK